MKDISEFTNKIIQGDCLEVLDELPDESVDLVITDPPYGLNFRSARPSEARKKDFIANDKPQDLVPLINSVIPKLERVMKQDSEIYWFCGGGGGSPILAWAWLAFKELEPLVRVKNLIVWDKMWPGLGWDWRFQYETIFQLVKGKGIPNSNSSAVNVIRAKKEIPQEGDHPTPKTPDVLKELILPKSKEGDIILDPFCGGGSMPYTAFMLNRKFIGIEIEPKYVKMAQERFNAVANKMF